MSGKNFWGDLKDLEEVATPKSHLKEQADLLWKITNGVLFGEISQEIRTDRNFHYELDIVAPNLNNYRHTILRVTHAIDPYPLNFEDVVNSKVFACRDEQGFLNLLEKVLSSATVRRIIASLISQSKS